MQISNVTNLKYKLFICLGFAIFISALIYVLAFGNPQLSKWIYVFQRYYSPIGLQPKPDDFSGTWKSWGKDGILASETQYLCGVKNGYEYMYNNCGHGNYVETEGWYKNGCYEGVFIEYIGKSGYLRTLTHYKNGKKEGTYISFHLGTEVIHCIETFKNNLKYGPYFEYGKNGVLIKMGAYQDGKKDGKWCEFDDNGNPSHVVYYISGEKVSAKSFNTRESNPTQKTSPRENGEDASSKK